VPGPVTGRLALALLSSDYTGLAALAGIFYHVMHGGAGRVRTLYVSYAPTCAAMGWCSYTKGDKWPPPAWWIAPHHRLTPEAAAQGESSTEAV
jgi:hypothetical protein